MATVGTSGLISGVAYQLGDFDFSTYPAARIEQFLVRAAPFVNTDMGFSTGDAYYVTGQIGTDFSASGAISGLLELRATSMLARAGLATYARTSVNIREADTSISTGPRSVNFRDFIKMLDEDYQALVKEYLMNHEWQAVFDRSHSSYQASTGDLSG